VPLLVFLAIACLIDGAIADAPACCDSGSRGPWCDVLRLAERDQGTAKAELGRIRQTGKTDALRALSNTMLANWNDKARTYHSPRPRALFSQCLSPSELNEFGDRLKPGVVVLDVWVNRCGLVERVEVLGNPPDARTGELVADVIRQKRFLPAKPDHERVAGGAIVTCRLEPAR
jgi:hypothetical protein